MGADLVASILEMRKDREPDWEAAERYLMDRGDDDLERIFADRLGDEEDPDGELGEDDDDGAFENGGEDRAGVSETKARFLRALEAVASCWIGDCRSAIKHQGAETVILIVGGTTYGEPLEEIADAELFVASGMARAAGFIVGDAS